MPKNEHTRRGESVNVKRETVNQRDDKDDKAKNKTDKSQQERQRERVRERESDCVCVCVSKRQQTRDNDSIIDKEARRPATTRSCWENAVVLVVAAVAGLDSNKNVAGIGRG